jgi:hypothetical protein
MKSEKKHNSTFFRSFLDGFASAYDYSGSHTLPSPDARPGSVRDAEALSRDWANVGSSMAAAIQFDDLPPEVLSMIDESSANFRAGRASDPIDLN